MTRCCSQCGSNGHNTRTCNSAVVGGGSVAADDSSSVGTGGSAEIVLFGVRVKVDPMRKSVSMNNLSQYEQPPRPLPDQPSNNSSNLDVSAAAAAVAADTGYASADDAGRQQSSGSRERKRGIPWTEDEHKRFLSGLQKVGKGDWRGISRNFVRTRTPTQVASHAQKYFLRRSNLNRRRRRSSLFDITTDDVTATPMEEQQVEEDNSSQQALAPPQLPSQEISPLSGFPLAPFAPTIAPVLQPVQTQTPMEQANITFGKGIPVNNGPTVLVYPIPVVPTYSSNASSSSSSAAAMPDLNLNLNSYPAMDAPQLSLNLSLSYDQNNKSSQRRSAFQVISSFKNGDSMISVA